MRKRKVHSDKFLSSKFYQYFPSSETNILSPKDIKLINHFNDIKEYNKTNTVSSFSGWVFHSLIKTKSSKKLIEGKKLEKILSSDQSSDETFRRINHRFLDDDWNLEFEDLSSHDKKNYKISCLTFEGRPLYGKPDLVYRNKKTNDRIIVEIKNTSNFTSIPKGGWFNLQCQLWCYSMIDDFIDSPNIFLLGDIRRTEKTPNWNGTQIIRTTPSESNSGWRIRKHYKLNIENKKVNQLYTQCLDLFKTFGGQIKQ